MSKHSTKVAGVQFDGRQSAIAFCQGGDAVTLRREPENHYDRNAIAVDSAYGNIGFVPKGLAAHLAPRLDSGEVATAEIVKVSGGSTRYKTHGVEIAITMAPDPTPFDDIDGLADALIP